VVPTVPYFFAAGTHNQKIVIPGTAIESLP